MIEVEFFSEGRVIDLEEALTTGAHILHFAGHGEFVGEMGAEFGTQVGRGVLVLIGEEEGVELFPVEKLARNLVGRNIRLAVFGACETARRDQCNAWTGIAPALTRAGIPAVVAMQYTILDKRAIAFSQRFYRALAAGETIDAAVTDGRLAIFNRSDFEERDWGVPVLYLRTPGGKLFPPGELETAEETRDLESRGRRPRDEEERPTAVDKRALRDLMISSFNMDELDGLCWEVETLLADGDIELSVDLEMVGGTTKRAIVMNLINYLDRRGYLEYLVRVVRDTRPGRL